MKFKTLIMSVASATLFAGAASADVISALGNDGTIYNIDTGTLLATPFTTVPDSTGTQAQFSPNALGVDDDGTIWTTASFNQDGDTEQLYVNGTFVRDVTVDSFAIAAGDTEGGTYHWVDSGGNYYAMGNNGDIEQPDGKKLALNTGTLGDIAVRGNTAYLSHNDFFTVFDLDDPLTEADSFTSYTQDRFVGLGFAGDNLYGIRRENASTFDLWSIDTANLDDTGGGFLRLGEIEGINQGTELTDASSAVVPLPAAAWMLLAGIGGLAALKRRRKAA